MIAANGTLILAQEDDGFVSGFDSSQAFVGKLTLLNIWDSWLTVREIAGMASGATNVNGNVFQWRDIKNHLVGKVNVLENSEARLPGKTKCLGSRV